MAPLKCNYCGKEEVLPFKCQFCQGLFCAEHRLPENHACTQIEKAKAPREVASPYEYKVTYTPLRPRAKLGLSPTEMKHLTLSGILVAGVGISIMVVSFASLGKDFFESPPMVFAAASFAFVALFLFHEIAHKLVAQHYGLWAEFRLTVFGALITLLSIVSPFKIVSPGAVMIAGNAGKDRIGKTAIAGPLVNIVLAVALFALTFLPPNPFFEVAVIGAWLNAFVAVFNLIPIGLLDGLKVFHWNKMIWIAAFVLSLGLLIGVFMSYPELLLQ